MTLNKEQMQLIVEALDDYSDRIADRFGYSAAEKYWDLVELIEEEMKNDLHSR